MTRREARVRIQPYIPHSLADRLSRYAMLIRVTESAVVETALREHLQEPQDKNLLMRRLDRIAAALGRVERDLSLFSEAFGIWVRLWFAHTPSVPDDAKRAARASAESRYRQFVDHLAEQFSRGARFINDLPQEFIGSPGESEPSEPPSEPAANALPIESPPSSS